MWIQDPEENRKYFVQKLIWLNSLGILTWDFQLLIELDQLIDKYDIGIRHILIRIIRFHIENFFLNKIRLFLVFWKLFRIMEDVREFDIYG